MEPEDILKEYEFHRNQMEIMQKNIKLVDENMDELKMVKNTLDEMKDTEKNSEVLFPIGADSFVKAVITDPGKAIVNVGASVIIEKDVAAALEELEGRIGGLEKLKAEQVTNLEKSISRLKELEPSIKEIVSQSRAERKEG